MFESNWEEGEYIAANIVREINEHKAEISRLEAILEERAKEYYTRRYGFAVKVGDILKNKERDLEYNALRVMYSGKLVDGQMKYSCYICYYEGYENFSQGDDYEELIYDGYQFIQV